MEKLFISELKIDEPVSSVFLLKEKNLGTGKNGRPFLSLILADKSGEVDGRVWDNVEGMNRKANVGDFVRVKGIVQLFQSRKQVIVHSFEGVEDSEYKVSDFMPVTAFDTEEMFSQLLGIVKEVKDENIRYVLLETLQCPDIGEKFKRCPAAKTIHHAYIGGLLEHTLSMCRVMLSLSQHYTFLDRDLLIFGAIYHDLGKIWELSYDTSFSYTDEGRLIGHHVLACQYIEKICSRKLGYPAETKTMLMHIVLSHHDKLEYGSPKRPKFMEAYVVAMVDDLDSKLNTMQRLFDMEMEGAGNWGRFSPLFDRYFYLGAYRKKMAERND